jgi:hypothetical protein
MIMALSSEVPSLTKARTGSAVVTCGKVWLVSVLEILSRQRCRSDEWKRMTKRLDRGRECVPSIVITTSSWMIPCKCSSACCHCCQRIVSWCQEKNLPSRS